MQLKKKLKNLKNVRLSKLLFTLPLLFLFACSYLQDFGFFYKTYTHPSLQFSIKYPRTWEFQEGGLFGSQVVFSSDKKNEVFRANANLVVTKADIKNIDELSTLSIQQLKLILNQYELITQNRTKLGNLDGFELRGRYTAKEGNRILRTVVAMDKDTEYVFTFTSTADKENNYTKIVNHMIQSFKL